MSTPMSVVLSRSVRSLRDSPTSLLRLLATIILLAGTLPTSAASLTRVNPGTLPALPEHGDLHGLVVADGTPLALRSGSLWQLDEKHARWGPVRWTGGAPTGAITGVFGNGEIGYAFTGPEPDVATGIARLHVAGGAPRVDALPALPVALRDARGTVLGTREMGDAVVAALKR